MSSEAITVIRRVVISNFRSIGEHAELELGPLTALVGLNSSGKSNIVHAIRFVADALRLGLDAAVTTHHGISAIRRWSPRGRAFDVKFEFEVDLPELEAGGRYLLTLGASAELGYVVKAEEATFSKIMGQQAEFRIRDGKWRSGPPELRPPIDQTRLVLPLIAADERFSPLYDALKNIATYAIFPDKLREPQKPDPTRRMDEHGSNWASILRSLQKQSWGPDLKAALGQLTGDIDDIRVNQVGGYLVVEFRHGQVSFPGGIRTERWSESAQESDGTLRMAGIITALFQEPSPTLLAIEEPELTIHPGALPLLFDFLNEASTRGQILLTTHSPDLLALLNADQIRVVERRDGVTTIAPMEESQRDVVRKRLFTPGDLMRLEGLRQDLLVTSTDAP